MTREEAYKTIRDAGVSRTDALVGLALSDQLERADTAIFVACPVPVTLFTYPHELGLPAIYTKDIDRNPVEMYEVYLPGLGKEVREVSLLVGASLRKTIFQMAVHEVRHRMQHSFPGLRLFSPDCKVDPEDRSPRDVIEQVRGLFERRRAALQNEGKEEWFIQHRTSPTEFDAVVLSLLALGCSSTDDVASLLRLQPL